MLIALKRYQEGALSALGDFAALANPLGPAGAFDRVAGLGQITAAKNGREGLPAVCLRVPTGGGKTRRTASCRQTPCKSASSRPKASRRRRSPSSRAASASRRASA